MSAGAEKNSVISPEIHSLTYSLDRTSPPHASPLGRIAFPPSAKQTILGGATKIRVVENRKTPIVTLNLVFRAGAALDGALPGLADFTTNLLTKGTARRSATEIAEEADFVGSSLNAFSGVDASFIGFGTLTKNLPVMLDLMSDVLLHPSFPDEEVERWRELQTADLLQAKSDANYLASTRTAREVYGVHPYGAAVTEESLRGITAAHCREYYNKYIVPGNAFIIAAGDVDAAGITAQLEQALAAWERRGSAISPLQETAKTSVRKVCIVERRGAVQSSIRIAQPGIARNNKDYIALDALNTLFGGYFSSRLNANLREGHGYTYGARSRFDSRRAGGMFAISCDVRTEVTAQAIEEIFKELHRIIAEPVGDEELAMMKNFVTGRYPLTIETPQQIASMLHNIELHGLPEDYFATYAARVEALHAEDLLAAAQTYLHPDSMTIVAAGDAKELTGALKHFGAVSVTDSNGAPITV